jgi:hypothetical protein
LTRAQDVIEEDGIWCLRFTPEAGSLKNVNSERAVPLHPAVSRKTVADSYGEFPIEALHREITKIPAADPS